jgi:hypothetical protein
MTTKQAATVSTAIATEAPSTVLTMGQLPRNVPLNGSIYTVLPQVVVLARNGFTFDSAAPQLFFGDTGMAFLNMTLGTPEQQAITQATQATEEALAQEVKDFEQRVVAAAKQMLADQAAAAAAAERDAQIAAAEQALAALKAATEQRVASLKAGAA